MPMLVWDKIGERFYETGVDHGVLYIQDNTGKYMKGIVWNGLISVTESPSGAEVTPQYADNIKYLNLVSVEEFGATIEAFTYPDEFSKCDGTAELGSGIMIGQQSRAYFGLSYRTVVGDDITGNEYGYKLHLIYGALASPSDKAYSTINDSPEAITFSWEITTVPVEVPGFKPTSSITIDSTKVNAEIMKQIEELLYGSDSESASLPLPADILKLLDEEEEEEIDG